MRALVPVTTAFVPMPQRFQFSSSRSQPGLAWADRSNFCRVFADTSLTNENV